MVALRIVLLAVVLIVAIVGIVQMNTEVAYAASCPTGSGCGCTTAFAPVICGKQKCRYVNMCLATCAGWTSSQCVDGNPN
ncbi:MAG: hypothetical protein HY033_01090 [Ignavibacteriae bacterium]|nr:hypothetical protein [Ignavibacteria bacterium]MBI3363484.1 hypothetical protein [Ignavibacteriota bacterium]